MAAARQVVVRLGVDGGRAVWRTCFRVELRPCPALCDTKLLTYSSPHDLPVMSRRHQLRRLGNLAPELPPRVRRWRLPGEDRLRQKY